MKKMLNLLAAFILGVVGFLPVLSANVFATGNVTIQFRSQAEAFDHYDSTTHKIYYTIDGKTVTASILDNLNAAVALGSNNSVEIDSSTLSNYRFSFSNPDKVPFQLRINGTVTITDQGATTSSIYPLNGALGPAASVYSIDVEAVSGGGGEPGNQRSFNHTVWFIWNCDGDLCRYHIDGIDDAIEDPVTHLISYITKYVPAANVVDSTDPNKKLNLNALLELEKATAWDALSPYFFIYDEPDCLIVGGNPDTNTCIAGIDGISTWAAFQTWWNTHITSYDDQRNFAIDPTGASAGANIISTNGDRGFRATIYDSDYYGISNASTPEDLTYYPSYWDPAFFNPAYDISGTTLENPKIIQSYLLEPQIYLGNDGVSGTISNIEIVSSGVPASAVTITKEGNVYRLKFNSNYYDKVIFRITSGGKSYYVAIVRTVVGHVLDPIDDHKRNLGLFVPETDTNEYDVLATYYWADGSEKTFTLEEQMLGDSGGKGLTMRPYALKAADASQIDITPTSTNPPIGVSYIAVKKGSTLSLFKGALSGSGKGTYYRIVDGGYSLDVTK